MSKKPRNPKAQSDVRPVVSHARDRDEESGPRVMRKGKTARERAKRKRG